VNRVPFLTRAITVTTRLPRPGEVSGEDYHFVSPERFAEMNRAGALIECAETYTESYGIPRTVLAGLCDRALILTVGVCRNLDLIETGRKLKERGYAFRLSVSSLMALTSSGPAVTSLGTIAGVGTLRPRLAARAQNFLTERGPETSIALYGFDAKVLSSQEPRKAGPSALSARGAMGRISAWPWV
jgi:hypothetical protein